MGNGRSTLSIQKITITFVVMQFRTGHRSCYVTFCLFSSRFVTIQPANDFNSYFHGYR